MYRLHRATHFADACIANGQNLEQVVLRKLLRWRRLVHCSVDEFNSANQKKNEHILEQQNCHFLAWLLLFTVILTSKSSAAASHRHFGRFGQSFKARCRQVPPVPPTTRHPYLSARSLSNPSRSLILTLVSYVAPALHLMVVTATTPRMTTIAVIAGVRSTPWFGMSRGCRWLVGMGRY